MYHGGGSYDTKVNMAQKWYAPVNLRKSGSMVE